VDYQKGQQILASVHANGHQTVHGHDSVHSENTVHHTAHYAPQPIAVMSVGVNDMSDNEDSKDSDLEEEPEYEDEADAEELEEDADDDDVALLELKEEEQMTIEQMENLGSYHKISALKAMQIQFYLAGSDVQKTYWVNRIVAMILPPQLSVFKLYKSYINTMSLSIAYQFHDSFTQEAYLDDFNDRWGSHTGISSQYAEALSEVNTYSQWSSLASFKYQLVLINMYEKMMFAQISAQQQPGSASVSLLELGSEPVANQFSPFMGAGGAGMYPYLQYYQMMLRFMVISSEMQLAQTGLYVANVKAAVGSGKNHPDQSVVLQALQVETTTLPSLYMQWASLNQQKFYIDMYSMMMEMYAPQLAAATANDRAENVFQNLVQTEATTEDKDPVADKQ